MSVGHVSVFELQRCGWCRGCGCLASVMLCMCVL